MRIGIFTECFPPVLNGVSVSILTLQEELEKRGHEFFIFTTATNEKHQDPTCVTRIPMLLPFKPKGGRYPIALPQSVNKWAKTISEYKLDLIHSQHLLSLGALGLKVAQKLDLPKVLTYHTLLSEYVHYVPFFGWLVRDWLIYKSRRYCNQYDAIIAPSESMQKLLVSYGVTSPISPIPTGINPDHFSEHYTKKDLYQKFQIPSEHPFLFLYVSRIGKEKNVYFLFDAMKKFIQKRKDAHLLLVGGGDELDKAKKYVKNTGLDEFITFAGAQPKEETNKIFGGADAFVFASVTETQGIIIFEAQASGLPIIAVDKMGPGDYIKDGEDGFLVPLNIDQFADKMDYLASHEEVRVKLGQQAKQNVQKFSAQKCGDMVEQLYERTNSHHCAK